MQAVEDPPAAQARDAKDERASPIAILRFRNNPQGSGLSRSGQIRPGGRVRVEYDPARLPPSAETRQATEVIICHMQFLPGGERHSGSVLAPGGGVGHPPGTRVPFEVRVPAGATRVELWFESRGATGTSGWDSRYGQNYSFEVIGDGLPVPEPSVAMRPGGVVDPQTIRVMEDAANKAQTRIGSGGRSLHAALVIRAMIADTSGPVDDAWADIHVFDAADELIHAGTVPLRPADPAAKGAPFVWEDDVYQGSGGGSGMGVWTRPDAHTIQYRLYCQVGGQIFTDGILHEFELPADEDVDRISP